VLFLDTQNRLLALEELFRGTLTQTSVYPREVVLRALHHQAAAVVLAHNHPSGSVQPSRADEALTQTLKAALALVDVRVLDHMIVGRVRRCRWQKKGCCDEVVPGPEGSGAAKPGRAASSWPRPRRPPGKQAAERRRKRVAEEDLFKRAAGAVKPIRQPPRVRLATEQPAPIPVQQQLDDQRVLLESHERRI
jgi:hypothetical protein